ncbi:F0F1 ATP synthase subunit gamma [Liquorilactobacillus mali]|uniref:ATP synthase gamma chain n=1 Tax=Liquorilactobacillus mali KCTC 3596 = DSM 20444 TaxID=1046596 RepID=J0KY73_9LACO|nr:F0F1 ATP synthase subunit gamma [Liquorilactobacillus mali]EJE98749.1 F0F1 ATP synthase subunit gamma [Liquorilactobacillus mali KCTC 3596 = DSM 20444]KRN10990.1 F0F1 ATP synthase subunit gamma [Liquorilactobacillus mali KCTC 3596 = DSM 20444]MDC7952037.1 F0F1 ATP synthase subunit gamma [Liquorilactobacillus mali]QFQ74869.1 F0F1 ATP synthase subunit gamma [Liquorilactobacillus mali]
MGASLQEIKRRISSTKKTEQITGAMQMVSTAKLSQIQRHTTSYQVYAKKIRSVITHLAKSHLLDGGASITPRTKEANENDDQIDGLSMLVKRPVKHTGIVVITSDRGLVGSYNSNVIKQTLELISGGNHSTEDVVIIAIGGTGADFFKKRGYKVPFEFRGVKDIPKFRETHQLVKKIIDMYDDETYDELFVCYNHFVNSLTSEFRAEPMLPISAMNVGNDDLTDDSEQEGFSAEYEMEPSEDAILEVVLPQYAASLIYGAILDAKTSEHGSSSTAMKSATDNAKDVISSLELQYNRARQSAITTEITEITGAQAALD